MSAHDSTGRPLSPSTTRLGRFLRSMRLSCGMSEKEAAEKGGLSVSNISKIETGRIRFPRLHVLMRYVHMYRCDAVTLMNITPWRRKSELKRRFGETVLERRRQLDYTQMQVATQSLLTVRTIIKIEAGKCIPKDSKIINLARALQMDKRDLLGVANACRLLRKKSRSS